MKCKLNMPYHCKEIFCPLGRAVGLYTRIPQLVGVLLPMGWFVTIALCYQSCYVVLL